MNEKVFLVLWWYTLAVAIVSFIGEKTFEFIELLSPVTFCDL